MSTRMQALPVRISATLRALLDQAGPISSATRALLIVGAHSAGYDITSLRHELAALLLRAELDTAVLDALARLAGLGVHPGGITSASAGNSQGGSQGDSQGGSTSASTGESQRAITLADPPIALDPFAVVGIDV